MNNLPKPEGYDSWIDYAIDSVEPGAYLPIIDGETKACDSEDVQDHARAELAELRRDHEAMNILRSGDVWSVERDHCHIVAVGRFHQYTSQDPAEAIIEAAKTAESHDDLYNHKMTCETKWQNLSEALQRDNDRLQRELDEAKAVVAIIPPWRLRLLADFLDMKHPGDKDEVQADLRKLANAIEAAEKAREGA